MLKAFGKEKVAALSEKAATAKADLAEKATSAKEAAQHHLSNVSGGYGNSSHSNEHGVEVAGRSSRITGLRDAISKGLSSVQNEMEAALRSDNSKVDEVLDLAISCGVVSKAAGSPAVRKAAESQARKQLSEALELGDPQRLKGAMVVARRLDCTSLPEFDAAVEKYRSLQKLPEGWDVQRMVTERRAKGRLVAFQDLDDERLRSLFQLLFDSTHRMKWTRDRKEDKVPKFLQVVSVSEVMNDQLWIDYATRREFLRQQIKAKPAPIRICDTVDTKNALSGAEGRKLPSFIITIPEGVPAGRTIECTSPISSQKLHVVVPEDLGPNRQVNVSEPIASALPGPPLERDLNEVFLFHGTHPIASEGIATSNFKVNLAGSNTGTLYGRGIYFSDNCTKADEYAPADEDGVHTMLVCRVVLGHVYYTDLVEPDPRQIEERCLSGAFDSVLGDRRKCRGTFREFVVFDDCQAYPNYVVKYRRIM